MSNIKKFDSQFYLFLAGIIVFGIIAFWGWIKLPYGFNFTDEGYHMTESWRLTAGDHFLKDKMTGALGHYILINSLIFKIYPDISLIQFRQIQFILTITALLLFGFAFFRQSRQYVWLPFVLSLFAFTGLDTLGMISNLNYHTYPHLFMMLYISFLFLGLTAEKMFFRRFFFLLSGLSIWALSLSFLPLGVIILSPAILFIFVKRFNPKFLSFTFKDLLYVLLPFAFCWLVFISIFNKLYIINLINSLSATFSSPYYNQEINHISWAVIKPIIILSGFCFLFFTSIRKLPPLFSISGCTILSAIMLLIIHTSLFGYLPPYYVNLPSQLLWFSSLIMVFSIFFWTYIIWKFFLNKEINKEEIFSIILMAPFTILAAVMSIFSGLHALSSAEYAIPAVTAMSYVFVSLVKKNKYDIYVSVFCLILLLGPFYYSMAKNDWDFTFFDVPPNLMNIEIDAGFGKGIYTNELYYSFYNWILGNAKEYTKPGEYAISYIVLPMVHVMTHLLPSLHDTYITPLKPTSYNKKTIEQMKLRGREPRIAFISERITGLIPVSPEKKKFSFTAKCFDFPSSLDPISSYVKTHMTLASEFKVSNNNIIRCYVEKKRFAEKLLDNKIPELIKK